MTFMLGLAMGLVAGIALVLWAAWYAAEGMDSPRRAKSDCGCWE